MDNNTSDYKEYLKCESIDTATECQKLVFESMGCGNRGVWWFVHYTNGLAHWSDYQQGWACSYLNLEKGDTLKCGGDGYGGTVLCKDCKEKNLERIKEYCKEFNEFLKETFCKEIDDTKKEGLKIGITRNV